MNAIDPSALIVIQSDSECVKVLNDAGMLNALHTEPPFNAAFIVFPTATHYCLAELHTGHADPAANGYSIAMLPKAIVSVTEAAHFFIAYADEAFPGHRKVVSFETALSRN